MEQAKGRHHADVGASERSQLLRTERWDLPQSCMMSGSGDDAYPSRAPLLRVSA